MKTFRIWCCRNDPVRIKSFWRIKEKAFHFNSFEYKCFNAFNMRRGKVAKKYFRLISSQFLNNGHFTWSSHTIPSMIFDCSEISHNFSHKIFTVPAKFGKFPLIKDWTWERHANYCSSLYLSSTIFWRSLNLSNNLSLTFTN